MKRNRTRLDVWHDIDDYFDTFFLTDRITCLCDLIIYLSSHNIKVLTKKERNYALKEVQKKRIELGLEPHKPFWTWGEIEPRKRFIKLKIKELENEK